ncbi:hypothetical protein ICA16_19845 [Pseudomonas anatoliensis]|uniref:hypothetical protein n=1 Tax=Pseudomonas anatoliensis TaxID=2710589 RepID=UPI001B31F35B|nr:hypothetical protein [Pseudomonas anatoliensis]MBP5957933.1 hypothetical protein [Pseudomonas anatoliensis]
MNRSLTNRHWHFLAALLLVSNMAAWSTPNVNAQTQMPDAAGLMREAQRLNREGSLAQASDAARAAMLAGRKRGGLDFTELDAGALLIDLLYKQARYDEARSAAEEQIAHWEQQAADSGRSSRRDSRVTHRLGQAIEASMMAGERTEVARLQGKLFAVVSPDPGLWRMLPDEPRLRYDLADFSMPLMLGQWKLTKFEPAQKRDSNTIVLYTQELPGGRLSAEIALSYDEAQRKQSAAERQESADAYLKRHKPSALETAMPDLSFDGLTSFKRGEQSVCEGEECLNVHWLAFRGDWRMDIDVTFGLHDEAKATEQMHQLFAALKWQSAPPLFRERPLAEQIRNIEVAASLANGVAKAAELAEQALPDAHFPEEIAQMQTYIGVDQYRRANFDAARRALGLAVPAWENSFINDVLYRNALDYAADIAYRQGRSQDAVALNRKLIEWQESDATLGWSVPKDENALVNNRQGVHLPLRVGDYRLRPDTHGRFYYENLQSGAQIGLTVGMPQSSEQELELTLRSFMSKTLGLQAAGIRKAKFSPRSAVHEGVSVIGQKWEFEVAPLPEEQDHSSKKPVSGAVRKTPTKMTFWIVDRKEQRSMLRAPVTDNSRSSAEADQVAQAVSW